ncbi:diguanylate cyclase [Novosphingobium profundi]|nr:diguanylate cyclase [Novosphingobium profundi]
MKKGFALLQQGQDEKAVSYFDRAISAADTWLAGDSRPRRCVAANKPASVAGHAAIDDALCDAHFGRGFALIDLGRGDLAEADLRAATEMAPTNAHFANEYAELFKSRREWQVAYTQFDRAWTVADKTVGGPDADLAARALRGMAYAKEKMGELDAAHDLIEQSLQYEPDSEAAHAQLAHVSRLQAIGS